MSDIKQLRSSLSDLQAELLLLDAERHEQAELAKQLAKESLDLEVACELKDATRGDVLAKRKEARAAEEAASKAADAIVIKQRAVAVLQARIRQVREAEQAKRIERDEAKRQKLLASCLDALSIYQERNVELLAHERKMEREGTYPRRLPGFAPNSYSPVGQLMSLNERTGIVTFPIVREYASRLRNAGAPVELDPYREFPLNGDK